MTSSSLLNGRLLRTTALGVSIAVAAVSAPAFASRMPPPIMPKTPPMRSS